MYVEGERERGGTGRINGYGMEKEALLQHHHDYFESEQQPKCHKGAFLAVTLPRPHPETVLMPTRPSLQVLGS